MRKVFILALIMSSFFAAQAGYAIRGIYTPGDYNNLRNYTLAFKDGAPIAAASMFSPSAFGTGKNTIVIIQENSPNAYLFPITPVPIPFLNDVEVRDFHYDQSNNRYVLCGSRRSDFGIYAFVATIDAGFSTMQFVEYPGADMFYSVCVPIAPAPTLSNYYLCGTRGVYGVIASVNRTTLLPNNSCITNTNWEYHKIIAKGTTAASFRLVASGRNPGCTHIGLTTLDALLAPMNSYMWEQRTEQRSHCVVSDDVSVNDAVILASSYGNTVTLNPVLYLAIPLTVPAVRFGLPGRYFVQDVGTIQATPNSFRISVAGLKADPTPTPTPIMSFIAWHGYVDASFVFPMRNNDYHSIFYHTSYEHYKIRYQGGSDYTGGSFQDIGRMGALFGTPRTTAPDCDNHYQSEDPISNNIYWSPLNLSPYNTLFDPHEPYPSTEEEMDATYCLPFKGGEPALKSMPSEDESEIIAFPDRIVLSDIPANTNYQIYNVIGQLIQTGVTTPDISTASLGKGVYILRLENGKAFKFVK
ncbi:MAG: T9SS type A sorting domain-containing protein [Bacteroidales bacterium]|nr:T9SS type A sorting domain-containing protein [Bacteroidales bacterium]